MSNKRLVACTSTGCIEYAPERYRKYDIDFIRVHILFEDKEYIEGLDFDAEAFYKKLETLKDPKNNLPRTSMPTMDEISAFFQSAIDRGYDEVLVIAISSGLGGTYNLIKLVAKDYNFNCILEEGMCFTIEPMINAGTYKCKVNKKDGWTVTTADKQPSAQYEHTLLVIPNGVEVLTLRKDEDFPRIIVH